MSDPPNELDVSDVKSRSVVVSWKSPTKSYGEILGYVLQLRDSTDVCHKEIFIRCTDCKGSIVSIVHFKEN